MTVLAASICSRGGKVVLSRQFVEIPKAQIETMLASLPKMTDKGSHSTVETEHVRYVYQPLEDLYIVLVTNMGSNILQDINTLGLFSQVATNLCRIVDEKEVFRNAYDIICAFDEIVTMGYRDGASLSQIKVFLEMDSHEEKIQDIISRNKEMEASEERKRRARQLELQRRETTRRASRLPSGYESSMGGGGTVGVGAGARPSYTAPVTTTFKSDDRPKAGPPSSSLRGKGMKLGKSKPTAVFEPATDEAPLLAAEDDSILQDEPKVDTKGEISLTFTETSVETVNRDGQVQHWESKGDVAVFISDPSIARIAMQFKIDDRNEVQYKTHPNVDKDRFKDSVVALRDAARSFPVNQSLGVVRWRFESNSFGTGIALNAWPSAEGGRCELTLEFDASSVTQHTISDFVVQIPTGGATDIDISSIDVGDYQIGDDFVEWAIPDIGIAAESGSLALSLDGSDPDVFFPITATYRSEKPFCAIDATGVSLVDLQENLPFTKRTSVTGSIRMA